MSAKADATAKQLCNIIEPGDAVTHSMAPLFGVGEVVRLYQSEIGPAAVVLWPHKPSVYYHLVEHLRLA